MRRRIAAGVAALALSAGIFAATPHAPARMSGACLTAPAGEYHRPTGAGSLAWMMTLAFLPACARNGGNRS